MAASKPIEVCSCCGSRELVFQKALWDELVHEWRLSPYERDYIDRQQGVTCKLCGSNLRSMALALAICRCYGYAGTLARFVTEKSSHRLRVLEINEAGMLTQFLSRLPKHCIARYPQVDMRRMPFPEQSFDLVVHSDTLEHVPEPVVALAECYRILAPGGYCIFTIPVIVDRMTRSRAGLPPSYHGYPNQPYPDLVVQTEYGADTWKHLVQAGFEECRIIAQEFPSALAFVGARWDRPMQPLVLDDNNGERMVPESTGGVTFWEHVYRYAFASRFVKGKRVLDVACGEGYGAAALEKAGAKHVIGVDVSDAACLHARQKYGIDARPGTAEKIPLPDGSVDVVVSFETIEHVADPGRFLDECVRVLGPGGRLIISTPDKEVYANWLGTRNPHHRSELTEARFTSALRARFHRVRLYTQHTHSAAWWSPRSFVIEDTPWTRLPRFSWLRHGLRRRYFRESIFDPTPEERATAVAFIARAARKRFSVLNPYVVRPHRKLHGEKSVYLIATAIRP